MSITNVNSIFRQIDLSLLKHFFDVATYGGFSKASRATGVAQPTLSLGVQKLERTLSTRLFRRGGKEFGLTEAGKELLLFCKRFESSLQSVVQTFENQPTRGRILRIGTALSVGFEPLIPLCERAARLERHLDIEITTQNTYELLKLVSASELDAVLLPNDVHDSALSFTPIHQDQITFVVGKKNAGLFKSSNWSERLEHLNLVNYPRETPMRATIDRLIREKHLQFRSTLSVNSIEAMKIMVRRNLGGAFVLRSLVLDELKAGVFHEAKRNLLRIRSGVVLATRKDERGLEIAKWVSKLLNPEKR